MSELNKMSVHALLEKVERLDVQLSDERMRARDLEIACHDERRLREIAERELERVRSALDGAHDAIYHATQNGFYDGCDQREHSISHGEKVAEWLDKVDAALASPAAESVLSDAQDAARWRALLAIPRIRPLGSAGLSRPEANNYAHLGLELWTVFSRDYSAELLEKLDQENVLGRKWLPEFADIAIAAQGLQPAPVAQSEKEDAK